MIRKRWNRLFFRKAHRRILISASGAWYLAFTIGLGVFALLIGNNVVYLIESFLLSGLILSGVISERIVSAIDFKVYPGQAIAGTPVQDWLHIENKSKHSLFCVEIGEMNDGEYTALFYVPMIKPLDKISVSCKRTFSKRGEVHWDGYAVTTSYPFGFAKKMKMLWIAGKRVVWIERALRSKSDQRLTENKGSRGQLKIQPIEGEVRMYVTGEDARDLVPAKSALGLGAMVRNRRLQLEDKEIRLDLTQVSPFQLEDKLKSTALSFYEKSASDLILKTRSGSKKISGVKPAISTLSLLKDTDCT